ncbi:MAG TPA: hypothetical protein VN240_00785, partial [Propylenella sp.]|nr:hypothetical protein [Propylenella sp.]
MKGVRRLDSAPCQAWAVKLKAGKLTGIAGTGVVLGGDWLFEGGWAFTDTPRSLSLSGVYLGSGAVWDGKTLSLIGPSHTADGVFVLERPGELFASNSLPFLLASAGVFDFPIHRVGSALLSLKRGLTHYRRRIYSGRQGTVYRFLNAIVDYSPDKGVRERQQRSDPGFATFEEYRAYLLSLLRQVGQTYGSRGAAVYVSRGYDSVACAALAAQIDRNAVALSIDRSRWGVPDDGSQIADALNLKPTLLARRERPKILQSDDYKEWWDAAESLNGADLDDVFEFFLGMGLVDECLNAPADLLSRRIVLTGFGGDEIWAPLYAPSTDLVR